MLRRVNHSAQTRRPWTPGIRLAVAIAIVLFAVGFSARYTNVLGFGDRVDRVLERIALFIDPPPNRATLPTVVVGHATPTPRPEPTADPQGSGELRHTPTPTPKPVREPVDVDLTHGNPATFFASEITDKDCAVAGTQMVLTLWGKGNTSEKFQNELRSRIGEWESWQDSHNGGWGPGAVSLALAAYGVRGYELRAYDSYTDALRDSAVAVSEMHAPVVMFPWWGAHTWVMTGYRADADPTIFRNARISGAYILDPWYPRVSSIWGPSDPPGNFEDLSELRRNWPVHGGPPPYAYIGPGWTRPEGAYPGRDHRFVVLIPTRARR